MKKARKENRRDNDRRKRQVGPHANWDGRERRKVERRGPDRRKKSGGTA